MERTYIQELHEHIDKEVTIKGTVGVARFQGKMAFFDFYDRTSTIQGVVFGKPEVLETANELSVESAVAITGIVNKRPQKMVNSNVQNGDIELEITGIVLLNKAEALPFELESELTIDTLLDYRPHTYRTAASIRDNA